jgi:hypothetical protein
MHWNVTEEYFDLLNIVQSINKEIIKICYAFDRMSGAADANVGCVRGTLFGAYQECFEFIAKCKPISSGFVLYICCLGRRYEGPPRPPLVSYRNIIC